MRNPAGPHAPSAALAFLDSTGGPLAPMKPKVLYVPRRVFGRKPTLRKWLKRWWSGKRFAGQEGFFQAAVHSAFDVEETTLEALPARTRADRSVCAVIVDWQCGENGSLAGVSELRTVTKISVPAVLFCGNACAGFMPKDDVLDLFSLVFKREPFKDLDRYLISSSNKAKIHPTMLACKGIPMNSRTLYNLVVEYYGRDRYGTDFNSDVFFLGQATHMNRIETIQAIKRLGIRFQGGIYPLSKRVQEREKTVIPISDYSDVFHAKIKSDRYFDFLCTSKINLVLSGFGEFTFRHQEAWLYSCFTLCESDIEELNLLIRVKPYEHYVPFRGLTDLIEKIQYYIDDMDERRRIAENARRQFVQDYSVLKHGKDIKAVIQTL